MTPEAQRIAIAEACGWKLAPNAVNIDYPDTPCVSKPLFIQGARMGSTTALLPDYLNSLDAMHEAENALTEQQEVFYKLKLSSITHRRGGDRNVFATAAQRAEAFLKTLNLWKP